MINDQNNPYFQGSISIFIYFWPFKQEIESLTSNICPLDLFLSPYIKSLFSIDQDDFDSDHYFDGHIKKPIFVLQRLTKSKPIYKNRPSWNNFNL